MKTRFAQDKKFWIWPHRVAIAAKRIRNGEYQTADDEDSKLQGRKRKAPKASIEFAGSIEKSAAALKEADDARLQLDKERFELKMQQRDADREVKVRERELDREERR